jgi:hypothetical protein
MSTSGVPVVPSVAIAEKSTVVKASFPVTVKFSTAVEATVKDSNEALSTTSISPSTVVKAAAPLNVVSIVREVRSALLETFTAVAFEPVKVTVVKSELPVVPPMLIAPSTSAEIVMSVTLPQS